MLKKDAELAGDGWLDFLASCNRLRNSNARPFTGQLQYRLKLGLPSGGAQPGYP
jgi:hypothetical protein